VIRVYGTISVYDCVLNFFRRRVILIFYEMTIDFANFFSKSTVVVLAVVKAFSFEMPKLSDHSNAHPTH